ncbi:MAG: EamA family transporter [Candidatus Rokubacteria bacterium]|nr:EamA family transporter [Candidatus Rokubacteria bacterium]
MDDTLAAPMPLAAVLLVLGAAVVHSSWNLLLKREGGRPELLLGALVVGAVAGMPFLFSYPLAEIPLEGWALVLASAIFETGYMLALSSAYRVGDLSLVYPVARGTAPIIVVPLAALLLGERVSTQGLLGVLLVVAGIFASHVPALGTLATTREARQAVGFAALTGLMTAGYSLVNKVGVSVVPVPVYAVAVFATNAVFLTIILRLRGMVLVGRDTRWRATATIGVLMMTSYVAIMWAMSMAPVSYVVAAREVSIVVGAALGAVTLRERHPASRVAGAAVIFAGLAVIALAR